MEGELVFRVKFKVAGGHVHCAVFCAKAQNMTFAKCGDLCVSKGPEFAAFVSAFSGADFIGIDDEIGILQASVA